jgi:nicotinamidase-related amidase
MAERVWERFLTEQDRAHLAGSQTYSVGVGSRPALLLIDLYYGVFGDRPEPLVEAIKSWPSSCGPAAWDALPHLQRLLGAAREAGISVVHVHQNSCDVPANWFEAAHPGRPRSYGDDPAARDRWARRYQIVPQLAPREGEAVIQKLGASAFWSTPLMAHLTHLGIDTLLVGGESTSGCVRASVVDGCQNRLRVSVVEECVFDRHQAAHALNLFDMDQKYADVIAVDDAVAYLERWQAEQRGTPGVAPQPALAR